MRRPMIKEFEDGCGNIDFEAYEDAIGDYEDEEYDRMRDDQILEGEKDEKRSI